MSRSLVAASLASVSFIGGCERPLPHPDEKYLAYSVRVEYDSRTPAYILMHDGNLMRVDQDNHRLRFAKTSSGYGEAGGSLHGLGTGMEVDAPVANVYMNISYQEALAYFDGDWRTIYDGVVRANASSPHGVLPGVDPDLVEKTLAWMVTEPPTGETPRRLERSNTDQDGIIADTGGPPLKHLPFKADYWEFHEGPSSKSKPGHISESVFLRLSVDGDVLLKITEIDSKLHFYKTSSGYGVFGEKVQVFSVGGGFEVPVANQYFEISAAEALAFLRGDWERIYSAALRQSKTILHSVSPALVYSTFQGTRSTGL